MKAQFHKNQRVFVKPVGTWALIERVVPQWAKGVDEPLRIHYDCGLGREFGADELEMESVITTGDIETYEDWRVIRCANKWTSVEESAGHPFPGSYPVVVTGPKDWGGWRVPGAEYDLDPHRIEVQARIMSHALKFMVLLRELVDYVEESPENVSNRLVTLAQDARNLVAHAEAA
jgi:hypothetical protein